MKSLLIKDGRIIDPGQGIDERGSLLVSEGKIAWQGAIPPQADYDILYAEGMVVCPGFIDLHCHLRQPGFEEKETIATGTRAAARGGFTTVCCMPNTSPPLDSKETIDYVKTEAEKSSPITSLNSRANSKAARPTAQPRSNALPRGRCCIKSKHSSLMVFGKFATPK